MPRRLTVQIAVTVTAEIENLTAEAVAAVVMSALHVGLEGAHDAGVAAPDPSDVELVFVDDAEAL